MVALKGWAGLVEARQACFKLSMATGEVAFVQDAAERRGHTRRLAFDAKDPLMMKRLGVKNCAEAVAFFHPIITDAGQNASAAARGP